MAGIKEFNKWITRKLPEDMKKGLRVGQSYMNYLYPNDSEPKIYYEKDDSKVWPKINAREEKLEIQNRAMNKAMGWAMNKAMANSANSSTSTPPISAPEKKNKWKHLSEAEREVWEIKARTLVYPDLRKAYKKHCRMLKVLAKALFKCHVLAKEGGGAHQRNTVKIFSILELKEDVQND